MTKPVATRSLVVEPNERLSYSWNASGEEALRD